MIIVTDFDGCLTSGVKSYYEDGGNLIKQKHISDLDSTIIDRIKNKVKICILSKDNEISGLFAFKKRVDFLYAPEKKIDTLKRYFVENFTEVPKFAYLGNSLDDKACLKQATIGFVPSDRSIFLSSSYSCHLKKKGGEGAFEEMIYRLIYTYGALPESILE